MSTEREALVAQARELGVYDAPEERTDTELRDAVDAERAATEWLERWEALPSDEAKAETLSRLHRQLTEPVRIRLWDADWELVADTARGDRIEFQKVEIGEKLT